MHDLLAGAMIQIADTVHDIPDIGNTGVPNWTSILNPLGEIAKYGLLGALFILTLFAYWRRDKDLQTSWSARLSDTQKLIDIITAHTVAMNSLTSSLAVISKTIDVQSEAQQKIALMLTKVLEDKK